MQKIMLVVVLGVAFFVPSLHAQSSNKVWFVTCNGTPTPSSDVSVQVIATDGTASAIAAGAASNFVSQVNFPSFNSPYDIAVDIAMAKVYVLDNNLQGSTPEYIYSFNLSGTPAQIAASQQIIYTMPVPQADINANLYPLVSGIALDPVNHYLYFNQIDATTSSNSYIGRLTLTSSSKSDVFSSGSGNPTLQTYYTGLVPGQGPIAVDATNIYLGAINGLNGNDGIYTAPVSGVGAFSEIVTISSGDATFANGLAGGVASHPQSNLVYYLTSNAGIVNNNFNLGQNAIWVYNTVTHIKTKIASGYQGYPNNIALDPVNNRYYFTLGRDGTGNPTPANYQAIFTGTIGSTNAPTLFYRPVLSGQDVAGQPNAGNVTLQGIYIQYTPRPKLSIQPNYAFAYYYTNSGISHGIHYTNVTAVSNLASCQLSWPSSSAGFTVQQIGSLANPSGWSNYVGTVSNNGISSSVTISPSAGNSFLTGNMFFRLLHP